MVQLPPGHTLQPTVLVHEAYLRLLGKTDLHLESRRHLFFAAARAMREILVEQTRSKKGPKRGGDRRRVELQCLSSSALYRLPRTTNQEQTVCCDVGSYE